jgi:hypothetical protein
VAISAESFSSLACDQDGALAADVEKDGIGMHEADYIETTFSECLTSSTVFCQLSVAKSWKYPTRTRPVASCSPNGCWASSTS